METPPVTGTRDGRLGALMAAAQAGDQSAYRTLLAEVVPIVRRVARGLGTLPGSVDDVVQDVLITIHKLVHTFEPGRSFTAWLTAIARRRTIDLLRRQGRQASREIFSDDYEHFADERNPGALIEERHEARRLGEAIDTLPPGQRQAIELALDGRSLAEGAELTGRSKLALKVNLHRAIRNLRTRIGRPSP